MDEEISCSGCGAEPAEPGQPQDSLELEGWSFGEFGAQCPECTGKVQPGAGTQGMDAVAEVIGSKKKGN